MSLSCVRLEFVECPACKAKPGTPALCRECLERRELWYAAERLRNLGPLATLTQAADLVRICLSCAGTPNPECKEHGR